jgi:hypothetical protein
MTEVSEHSPEAAAAGEAAAIAVEEIQSREAIAEAAQEAEIRAAEAEFTSAVAAEQAAEAQAAAETGLIVAAEAAEAAEIAGVAHEQAEQAAAAGDELRARLEALESQVAPVLESYRNAEAQRIAAEQAANQIAEVDVTSGNDAGNSAGSDGAGSDAGSGNTGSDEPRRPAGRLRRGRR